MNMKTWTNPSVEELEVKLTASQEDSWYHEYPNGIPDGNQFWGQEHESGEEPETSGPQS